MTFLHGILRKLLVASAAAAMACPAWAEDIDIYTTAPTAGELPNVLIMLDNSANWSASMGENTCTYGIMVTDANGNLVDSGEGPKATNPGSEQGTKMAIEKCALYRVINALPVDGGKPTDQDAKFNVGLMLLNESPSSNNGAYPRVRMMPMTTDNKKLLLATIKGLTISGDKGNNAAFGKAMYEMYLYFKALAPYKGTATTGKYDPLAFVSGKYAPTSPNSCAMNHIIFIGNGSPESAENGDAGALLQSIGGPTSQLPQITTPTPLPVSNSEQANWANEFAYFMRNADFSNKDGLQQVTTHTAALVGASSDGTFPNYLASVSTAGGGTHVSASNSAQLVEMLLQIFNSLQAKDQVFASASLPVALNARGTYLNQVYMGVFRPDANAKQRWRGNLKQYKFAADDLGNLSLVDANGVDALVPPPINGVAQAATGFILPTATSFWTEPSTFWSKEPMGLSLVSDGPDGEIVEKGGHAQKLRTRLATSQDARKVYTCVGCSAGLVNATLSGTDSMLFANGNTLIKATSLGYTDAAAETSRTKLIEWVRGRDNAGDEKGPGGSTTVRPSIHGDVLHSRPAVINYGGSTGVVVYYGANDGMLHAVDGNLPTAANATAGEELWSFVPEEMFGKLNRLRSNSPEIALSTSIVTNGLRPRDYFVDGPIGVYQRIAADGTTSDAIIYVAMRRGGRQLYAFRVKDPTDPKLLWKQTNEVNTNALIDELGQTWSEPKVGRVVGHTTGPVVIMGGGYDTAEDALVPDPTKMTMGRGIFVFDGLTGALLRRFDGPTRSVAADVAVVDSDFDGKIDRAYAVDLGGSVWRIDFETPDGETAPDKWTIYKVADLSGGTTSPRKFFYAPSVVLTKEFTALMFGSGDREKPLLETTKDHFFTLFDRVLTKGRPTTMPTPIVFGDLNPNTPTPSTLGAGCYMALQDGEKVVNGAATIGGKTHFGTNKPIDENATNVCVPHLGEAAGYTMPLFCTTATKTIYPGGGLPPSPIAGTVTIQGKDGKSSSSYHFYTGGDQACGALCPGDPKIKITAPRKRIYWYQQTNR
jgi:type IV pilus assembly protein PilY1